jgi:arylsulfatase A-like enzyme
VVDKYLENNIFHLLGKAGYYRIAYTHNPYVMVLLHQFRGQIDLFTRTRELCLMDDQIADRLFSADYLTALTSEQQFLHLNETKPSSLFLSLLNRFYRVAQKEILLDPYKPLFPRGVPSFNNVHFLLEHAMDWIMEQVVTLPQPYLAYFHLLPPHEPYAARKDFIDRFADGIWFDPKPDHILSEGQSADLLNRKRREYDEFLAYADAEFGRLYDFMVEKNLFENTLVIFTSDHGEMFERGIRGHVTPTLFHPIIRVPLMISSPQQTHRVDVHTPTSCVDLLPTLLSLVGQPIPDLCEGEILPTFDGQQDQAGRSVFTLEAKSNRRQAPLTKATIAMVKEEYKLIQYLGYPGYQNQFELFDLGGDPGELTDLSMSKPALAADLKHELAQHLISVNQAVGA